MTESEPAENYVTGRGRGEGRAGESWVGREVLKIST
jgi:hypothetical protein